MKSGVLLSHAGIVLNFVSYIIFLMSLCIACDVFIISCLFHLHCYHVILTMSVCVVSGVLQYEVNSGMSAEAADRSSHVGFTAV